MSVKEQIDVGYEFSRVTALEVLAHIKALNLYPFGIFKGRERRVEEHPDHAPNQLPLLMVHGVVHNPSAFISLRRYMVRDGFKNIFSANYSTRHGYFPQMVDQLSSRVDEVLALTGKKRIDIVAHSLGGLVARHYMTHGEGRGKVKKLVTLGTPHQGTWVSPLLKAFLGGPLFRDLRIGSSLVQSLNQTALPRGSEVVSIYSKYDLAVWPQKNCEVKGMPSQSFRNICVESVGHMGLLYRPEILKLVVEELRETKG